MYICDECGALVEDLPKLSEYIPCGDRYVEHEYYSCECQMCDYGQYVEADICEQCGEYYPKDFTGLCETCKKETFETFKSLMDDNFSEKQREYLNTVLDGEEI